MAKLGWQAHCEREFCYTLGDFGAGEPFVFTLEYIYSDWREEHYWQLYVDNSETTLTEITDYHSHVNVLPHPADRDSPPFAEATVLAKEWLYERYEYQSAFAHSVLVMMDSVGEAKEHG